MSKKHKKNNVYSHDLLLTVDSLSYTADEELRNLYDSLRKERDMVVREGFDSKDVETSICYVQRELGLRETRRIAHVAYVNASNLTTNLSEVPVGDEESSNEELN